MSKKQKGATSLSKRAPWKSARKPTVSVVTPPDLDGTEETLDSDVGGDTRLDMASQMDMLMSMIMDLSNKVNGQGQAAQVHSALDHVSPAEPQHDPKKTRWHTALAQDPQLEEAVQR